MPRLLHPSTEAHTLPQYTWALDSSGQPVHISQAVHSDDYLCPLCHGRMIARLGEVKQHHFAHDQLRVCTPDGVARAAVGRWIAQQLQARIAAGQPLLLSWVCALCGQPHTTDLLAGGGSVIEGYEVEEMQADVALLDSAGQLRAVVIVGRARLPEALRGVTVIALDLSRDRAALPDLTALFAGAAVPAGPCLTQQNAARQGIVTDPPSLRALLIRAVMEPPHAMHAPLHDDGDLTHVLTLGDRKLWLPPILWERAIGGLLHTIHPALQVISQEWPQVNGATIALYYVTAGGSCAVAVRRFPPGELVYARLDSAIFHTGRLTADGVARSFAEV